MPFAPESSTPSPSAAWLAAWKPIFGRTEGPLNRSGRSVQKVAAIGILLAIFFTPFLYWHDAHSLFNPDPYTYAQFTKEALQGEKLYSELQLFDKGPLAVLVYVIPEILAPRSFPAIGLFLGICLGMEAMAFVWVFRDDLATGLACTLAITLIPLTSNEFSWMGSEHASNLFVTVVIITAICISRAGRFSPWQCILAGMFTCFAMNVRQTALMVALVPATAIIFAPRPIIKKVIGAGWCVLGGVVGLGIVVAWVWVVGDIPAYLRRFYVNPAAYAGIGTWSDSWHLIFGVFTTAHGLIGSAAAILVLGNVKRWFPNGPLVISAIVSGMLSVAIPHREYPHYWMGFIPNLALILGCALYPLHVKMRSIGLIASVAIISLTFPGIMAWYNWTTTQDGWNSMKRVAETADQLAPKNSTLLVWAPVLSESVVFASKQPPANRIWILWMLDPPISRLLPVPVDEIYDQYLTDPPTEIAASKKWMTALDRGISEPEKLKAEFNLGRLLFARYRYQLMANVEDFSIYSLVGPSDSTTQKISP